MLEKQFVFHVGLHKTASTYLQDRVFPALDRSQICYVHKYDDFTMALVHALRRGVIGQDAEIRDHIRRRFQDVEQPRVLISSEGFAGWPRAGYHNDFVRLTEGLAHLFPSASIVLVVRNQIDWIVSLYKHSLRNGLTPVAEFLNFDAHEPHEETPERQRLANALAYDFSRLHRFYRRTFAEDRVHILFFEELQANPGQFLSRVSGVLNCQYERAIEGRFENRGYSSCLVAIVNRLLPMSRGPLARRLLHLLIRMPVLRGTDCSHVLLGPNAVARLRQYYSRCNVDLAEYMPSNQIKQKYYLAERA